jgi:glycosyltransferase involved in cell wall biosynthesis
VPGKIVYIMSRFPHLPETFILREMIAIEKLGWQIVLYPLIFQRQAVIHQEAQSWIGRVNKVPWLSWRVLIANLNNAIKRPGLYFSLWRQVLWENRSSIKFLLRVVVLFPRVVWMAEKIQADDVIHIHAHYATHPAFAAWLINQLTGIPYSVTVHAHDIFVEKTMLETKLNRAAFIVAISDYNREYLANLLGDWVREKTHIVRCGIDPAYYHGQENLRERNGHLEIISVGSLHPYKGHTFLVKACALLRDSKVPFRCRIVGGGHLQSLLNGQIREHGLEEMVELMGPRTQDEVSRLLETADCYVQPSIITRSGKMEGIPVALMEAMASEIPVVATSISGIPELVQDEETGWLVPPESASSIAKALNSIYTEPEEARRRAQKGRQLVINEFELIANTKKLSYLFSQFSMSPLPALVGDKRNITNGN